MILHKRKEESELTHDQQSASTTTDEQFRRRTSIIDGSAVLPLTGQTKPDLKSKHNVVSLRNTKLGNINEFIMQSKAYAGPQLNVKINY